MEICLGNASDLPRQHAVSIDSNFHLGDCKFRVADAYLTPKKRNTTQAPEGFTVMVNTALSLRRYTGRRKLKHCFNQLNTYSHHCHEDTLVIDVTPSTSVEP